MPQEPISPLNIILMTTLIIIWGSSFVINKIALAEGLTPISIATFRLIIAAALFLTALTIKKATDQNYQLKINKKDIPSLITLALTGITIFFIAQITGIQLANASIAAILVCLLAPIMITIVSAHTLKETLTNKQALGIIIAAAGTFIVIAGGTISIQNNTTFLTGTLILLATPALWTTYTVTGKTIMKTHTPLLITAYTNIIGAICLIPFAVAENTITKIFTMTPKAWAAILFLAFFASLAGYFIWFHVANQVKAAVLSSFLFAEPLVTAILATMTIGETITITTAAGSVLIFLGVYLVTKK